MNMAREPTSVQFNKTKYEKRGEIIKGIILRM